MLCSLGDNNKYAENQGILQRQDDVEDQRDERITGSINTDRTCIILEADDIMDIINNARKMRALDCMMQLGIRDNSYSTAHVEEVMNKLKTCLAKEGISPEDDDMQGFLIVVPMAQCIQTMRSNLKEDPQMQVVTNNAEIEERIFENMTRSNHYLCAAYQIIGSNVVSDLCMVKYNKTLDASLKADQEVKQRSRKTEKLIHEIYNKSCYPDPSLSGHQVSIEVVESYAQCKSQVLSLQIFFSKITTTDVVKYTGIIIAVIGISGNLVGILGFIGSDYQSTHKTCIYFVVKMVFETLQLIISIWFNLSLMGNKFNLSLMGNKETKYWETFAYRVTRQLAATGKNWFSVIIGFEQCLAVIFPFFAREYLRKSVAQKVTTVTIILCVVSTLVDTTVYYFASHNVKDYNIVLHTIIITTFLPWTMALICSVVTVIGFKLARKRRQEQLAAANAAQNQQSSANDNNYLLERIIFFSIITFMISNLPLVCEYVLLIMSQKRAISDRLFDVIVLVSYYFILIGDSISFYLFLVSLQEFRAQLKKHFLTVKDIFCETS